MKPLFALLMRLLWAAALVLPAFAAQAGAVFTSLHSFHVFPNGENPQAGLVQGADGNLYGTTENGGTNGWGTVFKISTNGALTALYSFTGGNDGANPFAGLVQGSDGYFYGTTYGGGAGVGTVFRIGTNGALTTLYSFGTNGDSSFGYSVDGANPRAALVQGSDGNFYGTTENGGTNGYGAVFEISTDGMLTRVYSFVGINDGGNPYAGLVQGSDGYFYGTTYGDAYGYGTVFEISTNGRLGTLDYFTGGDKGANPSDGLVQGSDGYLYGTTAFGGTNGDGTVFKISTNYGVLTSLYSFTGLYDEGYPNAGLGQGSDGYFYGTTSGGPIGAGTVFKISTNGALTTLHLFTGANDGAEPNGLVQAGDGYFYGTTYGGGTNGAGTVFKISTNGALTSLYSFPVGPSDGANPEAGLVQGSDGYFYGTTYGGGTQNFGTVFKISTGLVLVSLYSFPGGKYGENPAVGLMQGSDGYLYGTTENGGTNGWGTVFKVSTNGTLTAVYSFTGGNDGANPEAGLVEGSDGYLYGTTYGYDNGYPYGCTVFKISTNGALTTLHSFTGVNDGANPLGGLVQGSDGYFYGTTSEGGTNGDGTVFQISANGALTTLYSFGALGYVYGYYGYPVAGANPEAGLVQGSDGYLYGTTYNGGSNGVGGTVFKISTSGALTTLYSFSDQSGENPDGGLVQGNDGYFYGTTEYGGYSTPTFGTIFKISTNGALTTLPSFANVYDGEHPEAGLVQGRDGNFYGTTYAGGTDEVGTVFQLAVVGPAAPVFESVTLINGTLNLTWSTEAGGTYQLQYNSDLSSNHWINLASNIMASGATLSTTDIVTNGPQRFYRVVLSP